MFARPLGESSSQCTSSAGDPPLRILQAAVGYFPSLGGLETHVYNVATRLAQAGVAVEVLTTDRAGRWPIHEQRDGVPIHRLRAWPANRDYYLAPAAYRTILAGRWDLIHVQGYHTLFPPLVMLAALRAGRPYLVSFHS